MYIYYLLHYIVCIVFMTSRCTDGSQLVIQKTVETLFKERSLIIQTDSCKIIRSSPHQSKQCKRDIGLSDTLKSARDHAISSCEESFKYDGWNCSLVFNRKPKKSIFKKLYRETAYVYSLMAASLTHTVAKACASGDLTRCSCSNSRDPAAWQRNGCSDDFRYAKKLTRIFLDFKHAGQDQIAKVLKQDTILGINSIGGQLKEVCKCHGFSGSCTTKTCWKRLSPLNSVMGALKKLYHHAIKRKVVNDTVQENKKKFLKKVMLYLYRTPNLCSSTKGRLCKDRNNCATLCCGRGYIVSKKSIKSRCRCRMVSCCFVKCDTCIEDAEVFTCK